MKFHSGYVVGKSRPERLSLCREWRSAQTRACAGPQGTQNFRPVADVLIGESEPHPARIRRSGGQVSSGAVNYSASSYSWTAAAAKPSQFRAALGSAYPAQSSRCSRLNARLNVRGEPTLAQRSRLNLAPALSSRRLSLAIDQNKWCSPTPGEADCLGNYL